MSFDDRKVLIISIITSTLFLLLGVIAHYLAFKAFSTDVSFVLLLFLVPLLSVAGLVPFTINSFGVREGIGIYLFSLFAIAPEVALSVILVLRVLLLACSATGGLRYLALK